MGLEGKIMKQEGRYHLQIHQQLPESLENPHPNPAAAGFTV